MAASLTTFEVATGSTAFLKSTLSTTRVTYTPSSHSPPDPETHQLFKSLKSIYISNTSVGALEGALVGILSARLKSGFPVKEIQFTDTTKVKDDFVSRLKELVDVVDCY